MPSDVLSDTECQIVRCQSEHPDIYDAHYDAIEQLKAANIVHATLRRAPAPRHPRHPGAAKSLAPSQTETPDPIEFLRTRIKIAGH